MELLVFSDVETLLAHRREWDDLWERSRVVLPTARAELAAHWVRHFAKDRHFRALAVAEGDRLVAALPLVHRRVKGLFPAGDIPANPWSTNGELLLDETADTAEALRCLFQGVAQTPWPVLGLDMIPVQSSRWRAWRTALQQRGGETLVHLRYPVGLIHLDGDFDAYWAGRSKNLQKKVRRCLRDIEQVGPVELRILEDAADESWQTALETAWRIEDASWKGTAGSSVLRSPGMKEFYQEQARILAGWGMCRVVFLEVAARPIAFAFGWESKGVIQVCKIGYDPEFARFSPGHLLWRLWLEKLGRYQIPVTVDLFGPLIEGTRPWTNGGYAIGRLAISTCWWGNALLAGYRVYRFFRGGTPSWQEECTVGGPEDYGVQSRVTF